jgi:hypothetical protein
MARITNKDEVLKHMGESHGQHFTAAKLLLAAHGAGLGTCVTVLKEAASTPQFQGVGVFVLLFGAGLIASISYYASMFMIQATVRNSIISDEDPNDAPSVTFLQIWNIVSMSMAVLTLLAAIGFVIGKTSSL